MNTSRPDSVDIPVFEAPRLGARTQAAVGYVLLGVAAIGIGLTLAFATVAAGLPLFVECGPLGC